VPREIEKWRGRAPLFPLEQHRHEGRCQEERRDNPETPRRNQVRQPLAPGPVADLVVVLCGDDEAPPRDALWRAPVHTLAMSRVYAGVHEDLAQRRRQM
jgi:hypothetical protein